MRSIPILLALVLVTTPSIVLAQSASPITLLTDKQSYVTGDTITLSGTISSLGASNSAVLQVFNPFNVLVQIGTINIAPDGTFSKTIKAEGQSWENDGSYQIKVIYVSTPVLATATANVNFKATAAQSTTSSPIVQPPSTHNLPHKHHLQYSPVHKTPHKLQILQLRSKSNNESHLPTS